MERYEKCCYNCKHVTLESCKGCNTFGDARFQNFELRDELSKLESGKLVELQCKIGDTVYWYNGISVTPYRVDGFADYDDGFGLRALIGDMQPPIVLLGKDLFLTNAEAEAKLKELQG